MTKETLIKCLQDWEIDSSVIVQYIAEHKEDEEDIFRKKLPELTLKQVRGVIKMCEPFKPYFSKTEFSKLICYKVITFTKLHVAALSSFSEFKELNVRTFATPNRKLPEFLLTQCSTNGMVSRCDTYGGPFIEIA